MPAPRTPVTDTLLAWYDANARTLPWRSPPGAPPPDPYRVWLSEIMLQQTTVAAVRPYYARFTARWPDIAALAAAGEAEIMAAWAGLGYYARARNLHACAQAVTRDHGRRFPESEEELRRLPGIGAYTAAAIAAIAFGEPATAVDANVERVVARLFAIATPLPGGKSEIRVRADELTPPGRAGDFAQAMMDLGSAICTPRDPDCGRCPLEDDCAAAASGDPAVFPVKPARKAKPVRRGAAFWLDHAGEVLLVRRPPWGMLGGMRALPCDDWCAARSGEAAAPVEADWAACGTVSHVFTHFALELDVHSARLLTRPAIDGEWWKIEEIGEAGLPTLFAKAAALARVRQEEMA
ncbi:MAG: A/G-specific adenine glycosylase [Parasphingopyxis sp.]|nr:A/G-specific adenine glycosylase [Sphingomonadales bacterium]